MKTLYILSGNIASGKSTFALAAALNGAFIVDCDSVTNMYHCGRYQLYNEDKKHIYKKAEEMMIRVAMEHGEDVVINRLNHKRKTRLRWIELGKEYGYKVVLVKFKWSNPEVHAMRRMNHDSRGVSYEKWLSVATEKHCQREMIDKNIEKYDEIIEYKKDTNEYE